MEQSSNPAQVLSPPTQESVLRTLIDTMPDIIYAKDLQSRFIMCNVALARLVGAHDLQSLLGKTDADFFPPALAKQYLADERAILETGMPMLNREEPTIGVDGLERWDSSTKIPIRNTNQRVCGLVGITRDITEQKRASELLEQTNAALQNANEQLKAAQFQLIQFEKAQSLSRLAAGLAHEIKNPLAILEMGVSFLADELGTQENKEVVASMHEAITRANQIISNVMGLADNNTLSLDRHPLGPIAEDAIREIHPILENTGIRLTIEQPTEELSALVDPPELKRVLVNILTNSIQAIPPTAREGLISIKISKHTLGPEISHDSGNRSGQRFRSGDKIATIEIEDNGCGIAEENRSAIFDAFFTTKSTGTAVGLGLTVSRKIIELHGGTIEIAPRKDGGTIVSLRLKS